VSLLPTLYYIPFATLGAVVCNAVVNLVDWPEMFKAFFLSTHDCFVMLVNRWLTRPYIRALVLTSFLLTRRLQVTFFVTLFVSIEDGLGWGLCASVVCLFYKLSQVDYITLGRCQGTSQFVSLRIYPEAHEDEKIKVGQPHLCQPDSSQHKLAKATWMTCLTCSHASPSACLRRQTCRWFGSAAAWPS
jgi:MFS superfamily sulfate permease-like transporter